METILRIFTCLFYELYNDGQANVINEHLKRLTCQSI